MATSDRLRYLGAICSVGRVTNKADIEEAVGYCRLFFTSIASQQSRCCNGTDTVDYHQDRQLPLRILPCYENPEYLNEVIDVFRCILKVPNAQWARFPVIRELISCLSSRLKLSKDKKDSDEIMELFPSLQTTHTQRYPIYSWCRAMGSECQIILAPFFTYR